MVRRGERPPKKRNWQVATIGSSARNGEGFSVTCDDCMHCVEESSAEFMARQGLPPETTFYDIVYRMRCGRCKSTKVVLMIMSTNPYSEMEKRTGVKGAGISSAGGRR